VSSSKSTHTSPGSSDTSTVAEAPMLFPMFPVTQRATTPTIMQALALARQRAQDDDAVPTPAMETAAMAVATAAVAAAQRATASASKSKPSSSSSPSSLSLSSSSSSSPPPGKPSMPSKYYFATSGLKPDMSRRAVRAATALGAVFVGRLTPSTTHLLVCGERKPAPNEGNSGGGDAGGGGSGGDGDDDDVGGVYVTKRTLKYMQAIVARKRILHVGWLFASAAAGAWAPMDPWEVAGEPTCGVTYAPRRARLATTPLFYGLRFAVRLPLTRFDPAIDALTRLLTDAGGSLETLPAAMTPSSSSSSSSMPPLLSSDTPLSSRLHILCSPGQTDAVYQELATTHDEWHDTQTVLSLVWALDSITHFARQAYEPRYRFVIAESDDDDVGFDSDDDESDSIVS
jgi:hypothetical protein